MATSFKVLYDGIGLYSDADLAEETFSVMLEKDTIISGSYVSDKVVSFDVDGDTIFCSSINLQEIANPEHHQTTKTTIIHADDIDDAELEAEPSEEEFVVIPPVPPPVPIEAIASTSATVPPPIPSIPASASDTPPLEAIEAKYDNASLDEIKIAPDDPSDPSDLTLLPTTGNPLEDLDNLLQIYRHIHDDNERALVYKEFWAKFNALSAQRPHLLLHIPPRVRGFLNLMTEHDLEPYRRDRLMRRVLSRHGLLSEPPYIRSRFLFSVVIQFELFAVLRWSMAHISCARSWMALSLWLLLLAQLIHVGLDFGRGDPWRALLFEGLIPITALASLQFVDTAFTANVLRTAIEDRCAALATVYGRVSLNVVIMFFCLGSLEVQDVLLLFAVVFCGIWTAVIFVMFSRLKHASNYVRIATGTSAKLQEKFVMADGDKDGVLSALELRQFFKSYNQGLSMWQIELMISQYDLHRDGGLRFDALRVWFEKIPINAMTRANLLKATPTDLSRLTSRMSVDQGRDGDGDGDGMATGGGVAVAGKDEYTAAEREWLGLAGNSKYMTR